MDTNLLQTNDSANQIRRYEVINVHKYQLPWLDDQGVAYRIQAGAPEILNTVWIELLETDTLSLARNIMQLFHAGVRLGMDRNRRAIA
jgi:hypothetical protein